MLFDFAEPNCLYVAIDPSFTGLGCAAVYNGKLKLFELKVEGSIKDPSLLGKYLMSLSYELGLAFKELTGENPLKTVFLFETPPPRATFSAALYYLVGGLVVHFCHSYAYPEIYGTSALTIKSIHGSRNATKQDSVVLANYFARQLTYNECKIKNHNIAEAFLLLCFLFQRVLGKEVFKDAKDRERFQKPQFSRFI